MYDTQTNRVKYIAYFIGILFGLFIVSCNRENEKVKEIEIWQQKIDELGNSQLDSIYKKQSFECDSLQKIRIPKIVDSLIKDMGYSKFKQSWLNKT